MLSAAAELLVAFSHGMSRVLIYDVRRYAVGRGGCRHVMLLLCRPLSFRLENMTTRSLQRVLRGTD